MSFGLQFQASALRQVQAQPQGFVPLTPQGSSLSRGQDCTIYVLLHSDPVRRPSSLCFSHDLLEIGLRHTVVDHTSMSALALTVG